MQWTFDPIFIPGVAAGLTAEGDKQERWKRAVADAFGQQWAYPHLREPVSLELTFSLTPASVARAAVYNLLKATIDGLSSVVFDEVNAPRGRWDYEDWWVTDLVAEKVGAAEPGVQVALAPAAVARPRSRDVRLWEATIEGNPPVWAAENGRERAWRDAVLEKFGHMQPPVEQIDMQAEFFMSRSRLERVDIDNLLVPVAQTLGRVAGGDVWAPGTRIRRLEATKTLCNDGDARTHLAITSPPV